MQASESLKQRRINVKTRVDESEGEVNAVRKKLQAHNKEISGVSKQITALENKLEQKRGDRHSLLQACKVRCTRGSVGRGRGAQPVRGL